MIYPFPLADIQKAIKQETGDDVVLTTGLFMVTAEFKSVDPESTYVEPNMWVFNRPVV